ncbi:MAG: M56 family metallopeptidase [Prosthecobacter sp.]
MSSPHPPWLLSHLGAGLLLGAVMLLLLAAMRRASAMQRCWMTITFLAVMGLVTPWQGRWWPDMRVPVAQAKLPQDAAAVEALPLAAQDINLVRPFVTQQAASIPQPEMPQKPLWQTLLLPVWAAGAGAILLRLLAGAWLWRRLWAKAQTAEVVLPPGSPGAEIRFSSTIAGPMAAGRKILLPAAWTCWTPEEQNAALTHELAHVRHRDGFSRWLAEVAAALHWPSPLVWLMRRELRLAQEQRCDEAVLAAGIDATAYGRLLVRCAREHASRGAFGPSFIAASMARPGQLTRRLRHLAAVPATAPATRLRHLVWPPILACACLQVLHVRLVAEPVKAADGLGEDTTLVAFEIKLVESDSEAARKAVEAAGRQHDKSTRRLTEKQFQVLLRQLLTMETSNVVSYPRMVTLSAKEVVIRSMVAQQGESFTFEKLGKTGPYFAGTMLSLTPRVEAGGIVRLAGTMGINSGMRELPDGQWEHEGQRTDIDAALAAGESLILGPFKPVDRQAGKRKDVWALITPVLISTEPEQQESAAAKLRTMRPKVYDLKPQSLPRLLVRLACDADVPFWMLSSSKTGAKDEPVGLGVTMAPFAAMESLCEKTGLTLRLRDGIWTAGTEEQWSQVPERRSANFTMERMRLRVQPTQAYDFFQASLADLMRFLATDSSINFISLPDGSPVNDRLLTFHMYASPFAVMEKICEMNGLYLVHHNSIWHLTQHAGDEERYRKVPRLTGPEVERLRAVPPKQQYDFHKAMLGDVLRFLIKDTGIPILNLPDDAPSAQKLVTFSIKATPFSVLETLCLSSNLVLLPKNDTWFIRESP